MNNLQKSLLAVVAILACVAGGFYLYKLKHFGQYSAQTKFQILQSSAADVWSSIPSPPPPPPNEGNWLDKQIAIISSRGNLTRVVNHLHLESEWGVTPAEAVERLEKQVEVTLDKGAEIVTVTAWADKADMAVTIAIAVRKGYEEHRNEVEQEKFRLLTKNVEAQIELQSKKAEANKAEMEALQKKLGITDLVPLSGTPAAAAPQGQPEYAAAKQRYDSSMMLLNTIREVSARQNVDQAVVMKPIEVLEEASPSP